MKRKQVKPNRRLRLEYVEAGSLTPNPSNWRRHPAEQLEGLDALIGDAEIGWAGALLYNERTRRLIDGHARLSVAKPTDRVPVLIGSWSPAAEAKILVTLDPLGGMGIADPDAYRKALDGLKFDDAALASMTQTLARFAESVQDLGEAPQTVKENADEIQSIRSQRQKGNANIMAKTDTEKYLVVVFRDRAARERLLSELGLPADERYVSAESLLIAARAPLKPMRAASGRKLSAAAPNKSGSQG
jgi:hypothetical protein